MLRQSHHDTLSGQVAYCITNLCLYARAFRGDMGVGYVLRPLDGPAVELRLRQHLSGGGGGGGGDGDGALFVQTAGLGSGGLYTRAPEELLSYLARATAAA